MNGIGTKQFEPKTGFVPETVPPRMSYEDWLAWDYESGLTEWVDGDVNIYMSATAEHQRIVEFLDRLLGLFVRLFHLGIIKTAPYPMCARAGGNAREPDLIFVATQHLAQLTSTELNGPADLVIEVISEDSVTRDRDKKFYEYQVAGIREYWLVDSRPQRERADFYVLDAQARYQPCPLLADGTFHSTVLQNFWLRVDWLWLDDPNPLAALSEIVGTENLVSLLREKK
jgi:Uma2 family endonuclease